jgi:hypothetical protein
METLERIQHDRAATDAEKEEARRAMERLKDKPFTRKNRNRLSWDHGNWRKEKTGTIHVNPFVLNKDRNGVTRLHFTVSLCTDRQLDYIKIICERNDWEPPVEKMSFEDASQWLDCYAHEVKRWY